MQIAHLPVIALRIARVTSWGNLDVVIPGLVHGIQPSVGSETSGSMDPGDKRRDDTRG
jgi:hypothetical protein